jgi:hypothetical protein
MRWKITCAGPRPLHGCCIVRSSHKITPKLYTSHFSLDGSPRRNSGAIHSGCSLWEFDLKNPQRCKGILLVEQGLSHEAYCSSDRFGWYEGGCLKSGQAKVTYLKSNQGEETKIESSFLITLSYLGDELSTNLHRPVLIHQHVWCLQIPMYNRRVQAMEIVDAFCLHSKHGNVSYNI